MARQKKSTNDKMAPELASAICDDLPDGAYWAMMEELTGMEPSDFAPSEMQPARSRKRKAKK